MSGDAEKGLCKINPLEPNGFIPKCNNLTSGSCSATMSGDGMGETWRKIRVNENSHHQRFVLYNY